MSIGGGAHVVVECRELVQNEEQSTRWTMSGTSSTGKLPKIQKKKY